MAMNNVKLVEKFNKRELAQAMRRDGQWDVNASWHAKYKDSAYVFAAGFPFEMTEGDLIVVFSQFGEVVDVNLARDKATGKSRGFCFVAYEDQRSTVLAVDNFNGAKLLGRTLRVDHCEDYNEEQERASKLDETRPADELTAEEREAEEARAAHNEAVRKRREKKSELFSRERGELSAEDAAVAEAVARAAERREAAEREAHARMRARIDGTLSRHRQAVDAELAAEEERAREREAWRARKDAERKQAARAAAAMGVEAAVGARARPGAATNAALAGADAPLAPLLPPSALGAEPGGAAAGGAAESAEARWERMMRGGGKKKKKKDKEKHRERKRPRGGEGDSDEGGGGGGGGGARDAVSVEETNRMRKSLGLPPLRT